MTNGSSFRKVLMLAILIASILSDSRAQGRPGQLEGLVEDATGARIAGGVIEARMNGRSSMLSTLSNAEGTFALTNLEPGTYTVTVTMDGFTSRRFQEISVPQGGSVRLEIMLQPSQVAEQVLVSAQAQLLQPTSATQSVSLSSKEILNIPTSSRNVTHLIVAQAGVSAPLPDRTGRGMQIATTPGFQSDDGAQSINPSVNGARPTNNALSINGVDATNMLNRSGGLGSSLQVPLDALETVEVQTALYGANTGRNGGGNIQVITRSGSNNFHGTLYHYLQNEKLNGNEFFLNRAGTDRPQFRRNESGGTLGGPVWKDKTFFFVSVARTDFLSGYAPNATAAAGLPIGLGDTRTRESIAQVANAWLQNGVTDNPNFARNFLTAIRAFPAEQVPGLEQKFFTSTGGTPVFRQLTPNDIHPVAINILNVKRDGQYLIPSPASSLPILPGNGTYGREYLLQQVIPTFFNSWNGSAALDHAFGNKNRARLNYIKANQIIEEAFGWADASPSPTLANNNSYMVSLSDIHTISPRWVNDFRAGFFELFNTRISKNRDITNSALGIYNPLEVEIGGLAALMPTIDINTQRNSGGIGNAWDFFDRQRTINASNTVSFTTSSHTLQFGGEWRRSNIKGEFMSRTNGDLDYNNWVFFFTGHGATSGSSDLDMGDTRRDFLANDFSAFVQDDWKLTRNFTLNLGLRYDFFGNLVEKNGAIGTYYTEAAAARAGVPVGFQVPEDSVIFSPDFDPRQIGLVIEEGTPWNLDQVHPAKYKSTLVSDFNNFAPRVGFAWNPESFRKVVFRGGYGIFYERPSAAFKYLLQRAAPFFIYQNVISPPDMADPYPRLNVNPFAIPLNVSISRNANGTPSWRRADGTTFPANGPFSAKNNAFIDPFIQTPYVQQWTFNVQYEATAGSVLDLRYVGSRGVGLFGTVNLAQPRDPREFPVNGFNDVVDDRGSNINPDFFVDPQFLGLNRNAGFQQLSNWGQSVYHSFQAAWRGRMGQRANYNLAYTFSKNIDNISGDIDLAMHNVRDLAGNRAASDFDRTHRLTAAYVLELPNPVEQKNALHWIVNNWSLSGLVTAQTGTPFSAMGNSSVNATFAQPSAVRMDWAPGATVGSAAGSGKVQDRLDSFFNVATFQNSGDHWGNSGRNILRGPNQVQFDFNLAKTLVLTERWRGEFRWEMYNAFNTPVFANPNSTFAANGPGNAGRITATIGGPRTMQAALRLTF